MVKQRPVERRSTSSPVVRCRTPTRRKHWGDASMAAAMEPVRKVSMSINKVAPFNSVPRSSLQDRIAGRVVHGINPSPTPYLSAKGGAYTCRPSGGGSSNLVWEDRITY